MYIIILHTSQAADRRDDYDDSDDDDDDSRTPCSRVFLKKVTAPQQGNKYPVLLWDPKAHYRVQNSPPPIPILSQINPVDALSFYFLKMHFNIIPTSTSTCSKWSLPLISPQKPCMHPSFPPYVPHTLPISSWFDHPNITRRVKSWSKLLTGW